MNYHLDVTLRSRLLRKQSLKNSLKQNREFISAVVNFADNLKLIRNWLFYLFEIIITKNYSNLSTLYPIQLWFYIKGSWLYCGKNRFCCLNYVFPANLSVKKKKLMNYDSDFWPNAALQTSAALSLGGTVCSSVVLSCLLFSMPLTNVQVLMCDHETGVHRCSVSVLYLLCKNK